MSGGNLSDQQLKEFDAYLNDADGGDDGAVAAPVMPNPADPMGPAKPPKPTVADDDIDAIPRLHKNKLNMILGLLNKIDAKSHKDIVADLVDEMQYQRSVIRREEQQADNLKKLISLAREASKK